MSNQYNLTAIPAEPHKWSGATPPPAIGDRVHIAMNNLGDGRVVGYFMEEGWLGVAVRLVRNPEWRTRQGQSIDAPALVFGAELRPFELFTIEPAKGYGKLCDPWNVRRDGRHYCRAATRDHAEAIAQKLNAAAR